MSNVEHIKPGLGQAHCRALLTIHLSKGNVPDIREDRIHSKLCRYHLIRKSPLKSSTLQCDSD